MVRWISFRTAANSGHADAISVTEMNLERGDRLAVLHFHQRHPVSAPNLPKGIAFSKKSSEPVAIGCHRLRTHGVQRQEDLVASLSESTDPVLRVALAGIADQFRAFGGTGDERAERFERERRDALLDFQRDQPGPCDAKVQAIVWPAARSVSGIVAWSWLEPHVPIFRSGDLRRIRFVATDEPSEQLAGVGGNADRQQEMPHHRHLVTAQNKALNVAEFEWVPRTGFGVGIVSGTFMLHSAEPAAEEASAFLRP